MFTVLSVVPFPGYTYHFPPTTQTSFSLYPLPSDPVPQGNWTRLVIPLKRCGNLLLMEATIDSISGDFIIDTGAPYLILNRTYFRKYADHRTVEAAGLNHSTVQAEKAVVPRISAGELFYENVSADITGLGQLEDKCNMRILGLLGANLFSSFLMRLDVNANQMILYKLDEKGDPLAGKTMDSLDFRRSARAADVQLRFKWCDNKIMVPVSVAGKEMNWILDTGAETNVVDAMSGKRILREFNIVRRVSMTGTTGARQDVLVGYFNSLTVGNSKFPMQQTILTGMQELNEACSMFIDGILGYSFFSKGVMSIHFMHRDFSLYLYTTQ